MVLFVLVMLVGRGLPVMRLMRIAREAAAVVITVLSGGSVKCSDLTRQLSSKLGFLKILFSENISRNVCTFFYL